MGTVKNEQTVLEALAIKGVEKVIGAASKKDHACSAERAEAGARSGRVRERGADSRSCTQAHSHETAGDPVLYSQHSRTQKWRRSADTWHSGALAGVPHLPGRPKRGCQGRLLSATFNSRRQVYLDPRRRLQVLRLVALHFRLLSANLRERTAVRETTDPDLRVDSTVSDRQGKAKLRPQTKGKTVKLF